MIAPYSSEEETSNFSNARLDSMLCKIQNSTLSWLVGVEAEAKPGKAAKRSVFRRMLHAVDNGFASSVLRAFLEPGREPIKSPLPT